MLSIQSYLFYVLILNRHVIVFVAIERRFVAPSSPPQAVVERIEVAESAIIFHLKPLDNTMERMRAAVRAAAEDVSFREFEINNGLSPYELTRLIHIPNISHSTFVR